MKIELNNEETLNILHALRSEFMSVKLYFEENQNEQERIGVTTPEEIRDTYNTILKQTKEEFPMLNYIK
ncbi:hypothetical protein SAMN02745163_01047 [Clostridium cavendishii DSM 21758]|uniref:Uncharacterized protein n=1 Tax=Clostridium cavendishii DSM 21758 TaxID=1121302 RepID=A0A1M6F6I0_9CLOT|nr:hypothetical protein [Clostridium cavendishii]SHI93199.1 hypothetical protein SAMN02745163_01047 [Clostridium cavendishii DSM 21758]